MVDLQHIRKEIDAPVNVTGMGNMLQRQLEYIMFWLRPVQFLHWFTETALRHKLPFFKDHKCVKSRPVAPLLRHFYRGGGACPFPSHYMGPIKNVHELIRVTQ
jgi:hypothetical protein